MTGISKTKNWRLAAAIPLAIGILAAAAAPAAIPPAVVPFHPPSSGKWSKGPARYVDPFVGTGTGPGGSINLFPGAVMPFGMAQLSPDTQSQGYGYHYYQPDIQGFSMTHMSGAGAPNEGEVFFTATTGAIHTQIKNFQSPYSHKQETARPGYYQVYLRKWGVNAQLTATDRCGLAQFSFPAGRRANVLIPISHTLDYTPSWRRITITPPDTFDHSVAAHVRVVNHHEVTGYVVDHIFCGARTTYTVYFVMTFSRPFQSFGTWRGKKLSPGSKTATQTEPAGWIGAYASWPARNKKRVITVKIGISYVDPAGAKNNLKQEAAGRSFHTVQKAAWRTWNKALGVIRVQGGQPAQREVFYTSLYHSLLMPGIFSDADGRYRGFNSSKIYHIAPGHRVYCNYSGWDIYRSEMPLLALIEPARMQDMCQSIVLDYQQGGWVPRWPQINRYTNQMCGSPLTIAMCTAWLDGLHGFDIQAGFTGMFKDATQASPPGAPYHGEYNITWINKLHYDPDGKYSPQALQHASDYGSVSQIQEDCIAYAALYDLAKALGKTKDAALLHQRALYVQNVFDPADRFFRPRLANGQWTRPFHLKQGHGFIEGSAWQYQWLAPADLNWLVHAVGRQRFNRRLDAFFSYKTPNWVPQYYNPYNEPDVEAPFEYNFSGEPWKTQAVVRRILRENYTLSPNGVPGNDDCGEMSSWAVLSMMGLYTVDPASTAFEISSPAFRKIVIHLRAPYAGKRFVIQAPPGAWTRPYIQSVQLNGKPRSRCWLWAREITRGGKLDFQLGKKPNKRWGAAPADRPPSLGQ